MTDHTITNLTGAVLTALLVFICVKLVQAVLVTIELFQGIRKVTKK